MMRRVVVTGLGICSPLGNTPKDVKESLRRGKSGASFAPAFAEYGLGCQIGAFVKDLPELGIDRKKARAMGIGNLIPFSVYATQQAIADSGLTPQDLHSAGIIYGNGGPSTYDQVTASLQMRDARKPTGNALSVFPAMTSGPAAFLATYFEIRRMNFMVGAACATSAITIGEAAEKILHGKANVMLAGGTESADVYLAQHFDIMRAMCRDSNNDPIRGSRPFDATRSGFVLGEGAGTLVLEELEHAKARGARIYAELVGYGTSSDGKDLTNPDQDGAERSMREALEGFGDAIDPADVDYLNTHGTGTPAGDTNELKSIKGVFEEDLPLFSSTKSLSGHSLGAAGAQEAIYCLLMMDGGFIAPSINVSEPDPLLRELGLGDMLLTETLALPDLDVVMSNGFGFGGVNATLLFQRYNG